MDYGKDPRQRRNLKSQKIIQTGSKGFGKITWKQMWFDLIAAKTPPKKVDWQPNTVLVSLGKPYNLNKSSDLPPPLLIILNGQHAPAGASEVQFTPSLMQAKIASRLGSLGAVELPC